MYAAARMGVTGERSTIDASPQALVERTRKARGGECLCRHWRVHRRTGQESRSLLPMVSSVGDRSGSIRCSMMTAGRHVIVPKACACLAIHNRRACPRASTERVYDDTCLYSLAGILEVPDRASYVSACMPYERTSSSAYAVLSGFLPDAGSEPAAHSNQVLDLTLVTVPCGSGLVPVYTTA